MTKDKGGLVGQFPDKDTRTFGFAVAKGAIGEIPFVGGVLQEFVDRVIGDPLKKRQDEWFKSVGEALAELQGRFEGFDPSGLADNQEFLSTVYEASQQAMKNHRQEKLEALRAAVLNTALGIKLDEVLRSRFLALVDQYSPVHLRALRLLCDPTTSPEMTAAARRISMGSFDPVIKAAFTGAEEAAVDVVLADLARDGLAESSPKVMQTGGDALLRKRSTALGDDFLRFITDPRTNGA
jgi:hypothetical protein